MSETRSTLALTRKIERELEARAGIDAVVEIRGQEITLTGLVDTDEARLAAADVVADLAPSLRLTNDLEVITVVPGEPSDLYGGAPAAPPSAAPPRTPGPAEEPPESLEEIVEREEEIEPDFTDQPLDTSGLAMAGVEPDEEDESTFFPPTDPVVTSDERGKVEVLGGFSATSGDDVSVDRSASDGGYGDEAIADAVRRELREDAATTDLRVEVEVEGGVVYLRGTVPTVDDAENVEEVAGRVPGVQEVVEELSVPGV
jgi:osmotically-inducible protein OsmY